MSSRDDDQNLESPNDARNPPTPANEGTNGNGDRPTRSITVSIQYSYLNPNGLANLNQPNAGVGGNEEVPQVTRPDGALILSFRDVPTSTPQERLESIISIAAELAMRRFSDLMSQPKGITKEQFEQLPVMRISELPHDQSKICSICYDSFEDEPENLLKRSRDDSSGDRSESTKKQRSESPAVLLNPQESVAENSGGQIPQTSNDDENPTYRHSPVKLPCGHVFGRECLFKWSQLENSCPLCRNKIVEAAAGASENTNENMANLNADAFERIRQALYSTPQQEQEAGDGEIHGTSNEAPETRQGSDLQNFTFSRSGILLLRPDGLIDPASRLPSNTPGAEQTAEEAASGANPSTAGLPAFAPFGPGSTGNNRRIQWIPLPIATVQRGLNNPNSDNNGGADEESIEGNNGLQQDRSPNERLRAILNNIFNVTHSADTMRNNESGTSGASGAPSNISSQSPTSASTIPSADEQSTGSTTPVPRRRSFLDHILRITNRHRNRSSNGNFRTSTPSSLQPANSMFNSGVASYRNRDGQVSTFNVTDGPLPSPSQDPQAEQAAANTDRNGNLAHPRSNNGEPSSDSYDTSS